MIQDFFKLKIYFPLLLACLILAPKQLFSCTIVSAIAANGEVWNMNNEDGPFGVAGFINVFPKTKNSKFGYYTLSYFSPEFGEGGSMQGGMNEAGLTFDFNAIKPVTGFDPTQKLAFPEGDNAILPHILANMSSVEEVMAFFQKYWFQNGFYKAQMHVADSQGRFAIISASGMKLVEKGQSLVSTNFDICGNENGSSCWRYPIATSRLAELEVGLSSMTSIAKETAQKTGFTLYTNIQNLSTGEIWFFSQQDPGVVMHTNIKQLLEKGRKSYAFNDLKSITENREEHKWQKPDQVEISETDKNKYIGNYHNSFTGKITVKTDKQGLAIGFADGRTEVFFSEAKNRYFITDADVSVEFLYDKEAKKMAMDLYQKGFWSFRAWVVE